MKKYIVPAFLLLVLLIAIGVSCKTTPPPEPAPVEEPKPQVSPDVAKRAEDARKRAIDFECPVYFPSDWESVEAQYVAAAGEPTEQIVQAYDELFKKTVPLYAQAWENEVMSVRGELIDTGLRPYFPEYLQAADKIALEALDQYEAGDPYAARDTAVRALTEYETLLAGAKVYMVRHEIVFRGFDSYDSDNFGKADEYAAVALDEYDAGDNKAVMDNAGEAGLRYSIILSAGWLHYAADRWTFATNERELALANKVNIASRDIFREAETLYGEAEEAIKAERYEDAAHLFTAADARYLIGIHDTDAKRRRALETLMLAEVMVEQSDEAATEAEKLLEGGSK